MKIRGVLNLILFAAIIGVFGCKSENKELKNEARIMADAMCKSMGIMNSLKQTSPADSAGVARLQGEYRDIQSEMTRIHEEFRAKYGEKTTSVEFTEEFRTYLNESMLECKNLSKEDRETFEKQVK